VREFTHHGMKKYFSWKMDIICYFIIGLNGGE